MIPNSRPVTAELFAAKDDSISFVACRFGTPTRSVSKFDHGKKEGGRALVFFYRISFQEDARGCARTHRA